MSERKLHVRSHVGRDLLQSAALFKHEWLVAWEYVSNGLQYLDPGVDPVVRVTVDSREKKITVVDNGRGMLMDDLANYFVMHGENVDRKRGQPGRGMFGTGKSAAFGIAEKLRVTTVRNGKLSSVELSRSEIERAESGDPIPVHTLAKEVPSSKANGTSIEIEGIYLRTIDQGQIVKFLERHISRWPRATVYVNNRLCEYEAPPIAEEHRIAAASSAFADIAPAELVVRVAKGPLEESQQGISIFSRGVWLETTLAGSERRDMANFIFGEVEVPALADDRSPVPAYDQSRSMTLNRSNPTVQRILAFIGFYVEQVRRKLVEEERRRKRSEEAKRLEKEAGEIAKIINADFDAYRTQLAKAVSRALGGKDSVPAAALEAGDVMAIVPGGDFPAKDSDSDALTVPSEPEPNPDPPNPDPEPADPIKALEEGESETATNTGAKLPRKPKPTSRGGFTVEFRNLGREENRAKYERDGRVIFINLDHPQLSAAVSSLGIEDITFKRLAYEVAFTEYSIALTSEMAQAGHFIDFFEPLTVTRETLNRVARSAAALYRPNASISDA